MRLILSLILLAAAAGGECVKVSSDRILARDLVSAVPLLRDLDPDTLLGFAPYPGTERVIWGRDLILTARRSGVTLTAVPDVCIVRELRLLSREEMQDTLTTALGIQGARVEILEFSSQPLPPGRLEFRRSGLNQPPAGSSDAPVLWRGRLMYDANHSLAVWAKVKITVERPEFFASQDIPAGAVISEQQIRAVSVDEFPFPGPWIESSIEIIGKLARRSIPGGQRFAAGMLEEAKDVVRGDIVQVRVIDGAATLSMDAIAASSGKKGDTILVHNSSSGRNFKAVVEEKGKAVVRPAGDD